MTTKTEALTMALEALSSSQDFTEASSNGKLRDGWGNQLDEAEKAITAIKEALAQPLTEQERKSYQAGHNAGVAHHKQAMGERVLIGWTPQELKQIKGMTHDTRDVYYAMQDKVYEYERILREKNKEIAALNKTQLDQALERNFCHRCGKRLMSALGPVSLHTCTPPHARTFDDYGNKII